MKYLIRHKWFVWQAGRTLGVNWFQLLIHDWSKFLPSEWFPYVNYFYGEEPWSQEEIRRFEQVCCSNGFKYGAEYRYLSFDHAWNLHQKRNRHHWQFWVLLEDSGEIKTLEMPEHLMLEMIADWAGAGRAITGKWEIEEWYEKNKHKMQIHTRTHEEIRLRLLFPKWKKTAHRFVS